MVRGASIVNSNYAVHMSKVVGYPNPAAELGRFFVGDCKKILAAATREIAMSRLHQLPVRNTQTLRFTIVLISRKLY